jgi:hypothetical protein
MGVLSGKDVYNSKWTTAEITDSSSRLWFVPIKYTIGDYFLTEIDRQIYCFKLEGHRIKTHRNTLTKSFRVMQFDTSHYLPISPADIQELEKVLKANSLPKMNTMLFNILKVLGSREKHQFTQHDITALVKEIATHQNEYSEQVQNIKNYLDHLNVEKIVTPVRKVVEFIENDLMATDPKFLGDIVSSFQRMDIEHKKMTNTPITGKIAWAKIMAIVAIIALVGVIGVVIWQGGYLNNLVPQIGSSGNAPAQAGQLTQAQVIAKYPTPEAAKAAVDRGEIPLSAFPKDFQGMISKVKTPTAQAKP